MQWLRLLKIPPVKWILRKRQCIYRATFYFLTFNFYFILEYSWFTMYVTLVSSVQQHDLVIHTHIFILFQILFPIKVITEYWAKFPVVYSRSLWTIYFIYNSVNLNLQI